jgi:hypothetical protein
MTYHTFQPAEGEPFGSFETFEWDALGLPDDTEPADRVGWYWWACFPGCLPDGEPMGPFESEEAAIEDANQC